MKNFIFRTCTVFILSAFFFCVAGTASAATLGLSPAAGADTYGIGQLFSVTVVASTAAGESLNAVSGTITYPANVLQLVSADTSGTVINFWITQPEFGTAGQADFEGGVYNPGYTGSKGKIVTFLFKAKAVGDANLTFSSASILANDGQGTNILSHTDPALIHIVAASAAAPVVSAPQIVIGSKTHPDQSAWYDSGDVEVNWTDPDGTTAVKTSFDQDGSALPTKVTTPPEEEETSTLGDGTWYFHLQAKDSKNWGPVSTFRINIDTSAVPPPVFDRFPSVLTAGDVLLVSGSAPKNSSVRMTLTSGGGQVTTQTAQADGDGRFQAVWTGSLGEGAYNLTAVSVNQHGVASTRAAAAVVTVQASALVRVTKPALDYSLMFVIIAALVFFCVAWIWVLIERFRHFRKGVRADIKKANQLIHTEFKKLLDKASSKRKLTVEEERMLSIIKDNIHEAEEDIEKDVREIGQ